MLSPTLSTLKSGGECAGDPAELEFEVSCCSTESILGNSKSGCCGEPAEKELGDFEPRSSWATGIGGVSMLKEEPGDGSSILVGSNGVSSSGICI